MIKAVVFDLDDTLFPERDYVLSGFKAAAAAAKSEFGISDAEKEFVELFEISRERVFDRFAAAHGLESKAAEALTAVYRDHEPDISLTEDVRATLIGLREKGVKLGIITDGRPDGQKKKIAALGLKELVDKIIITDELGGTQYRKPNPKAFELMCDEFGIAFDQMLYVGDNPQKDFAIGAKGVVTARLFQDGVYAGCPYADGIKENYTLENMSDINNYLNDDDDELLKFVKDKLLKIMDFIHEVCEKEGIKYSLSGGTMLGAVRHKGFIPWDDDIDITMPREEFNKFESVIEKYCKQSGEFEYFLYRRTPRVRFAQDPIFGNKQVGGIKVDIFLLDNLPDEMRKRKRLLFKLKIIQGMMHKGKVNWSRYSFKARLQLMFTKFLGLGRSLDSIVKKYFKVSARYNDKVTREKFISNDLFAVCHIPYKREWVEDVITVPYEDKQYCIFKGYDEFLRIRYGDYMQLPPIEQRKHHHSFTLKDIGQTPTEN